MAQYRSLQHHDDRSLQELWSDMTSEAGTLVRKEIELAKLEPLKQQATEMGKGVAGELQQSAQARAEQVKERASEAVQQVKEEAQASSEEVKGQAQSATAQVKQKGRRASRQAKQTAKQGDSARSSGTRRPARAKGQPVKASV